MTTYYAWPIANQKVLLAGYNELGEDTRREFKPQVGPSIRARLCSFENTLFTFSTIITFSDWDILMAWYTSTLKNGSFPITRNHPRLGVAIQIRAQWESRPESGTPVSHTEYQPQFKLRQLP